MIKERFGVILPPSYPDYRAETDHLYPGQPIVIRNRASVTETEFYLADICEQFSAAANDAGFYKSSFALMAARHGRSGFVKPFHPVHDGKADITQKPDLAYIYTGDDDVDAAESLHHISADELPSLCMKFQNAALNPALIKWFRFYHELAHAAIFLEIHPFPNDQYHKEMEEMVCDSFATLYVLREFGAASLPLLHTIADMRLTGFKESGPRHFTTPAIRAVIDDFESGRLSHLKEMGPEDIFSHAHVYSNQHFLYRAEVEEWQEKTAKWPVKFMPGWDRYCMVFDTYCKADEEKPWRRRQAKLFHESETIMNRYSIVPNLFR